MLDPMVTTLNATGFQPAFLPRRFARVPEPIILSRDHGARGVAAARTLGDGLSNVLGSSADRAADLPKEDEERLSDEGGKKTPANMALIVRHALHLIDVPFRHAEELVATSRDITFRCAFGGFSAAGITLPHYDERLAISRRLALDVPSSKLFIDFAFQFLMVSTLEIRMSGKSNLAVRLSDEIRRQLQATNNAVSDIRAGAGSTSLTIAAPRPFAIAFKSFRIISKGTIAVPDARLPLPGKILDVLPERGSLPG
ncbi:hypothetical protein ASC97_29080 [Rhizobium sp. Root1203]|uniref:hypothetical protein n=1 Tax=Rhizobium sp. Root1203 TaxID=1736427 RepID=UPI000709919E|nr:hypothetical protein [Rhizobium sp. Root1203]KQV19726.1 hypothetical protein ASC97_29080 [Rhizobium sp. Root1203]